MPDAPATVPGLSSNPRSLTGPARAAHVAAALLDAESGIISSAPEEAARKFQKLAADPFTFFRGTADLFYRDLTGVDAMQPRVLAYGDVHPDNMGVLRAPSGELFYGLDDHDESSIAPFSWDLRRGVTALELAGRSVGFDDSTRRSVNQAFIDGYRGAIDGDSSKAPDFVRDLIEDADDNKRSKYLAKYVDGGEFVASERLVPIGDDKQAFAAALKSYRKALGKHAPDGKKYYRLKDVAERKGSGTGSIGLKRYYLLLEGPKKKNRDDRILEIKERRPSVLERHVTLTPHEQLAAADKLERAVLDRWTAGDRFSGVMTIDGVAYKVRERHPAHERVELAELDAEQLADYARFMGSLIGETHTDGQLTKPKATKKRIGEALDDQLAAELIDFGAEQADRTASDWNAYAARLEAL